MSSPFDISDDFLSRLWSYRQPHNSGGSASAGSNFSSESAQSGPESPAQARGHGGGGRGMQPFESEFMNFPFSVLRFLRDSALDCRPPPPCTPMEEFMRNGVVSNEIPESDISGKTLMTKTKKVRDILCPFCRNNGESSAVYRSHGLRDSNGKITCPVLRRYVCPICKSTGDNAHTISYCPSGKSTDEKKTVKKAAKKPPTMPHLDHVEDVTTLMPDCRDETTPMTSAMAQTGVQPPTQIRLVPIPVSCVSAAALASFQNIINSGISYQHVANRNGQAAQQPQAPKKSGK